MISAIALIVQAAPDFGGVCTRDSGDSAILDLPVELVDGRSILYKLLLKQDGERVTAQEETPQHLPSFCPERHINSNGTFCLYYADVTRLDVIDKVSAIAWLETVYKFLRLQERARIKRRWPNNNVWAHGNAASYQLLAESAATAINDKMASALADNRLHLKQRHSMGRPILELSIDGFLIYRVWELEKRVINQRQRCFCGWSGLRVPKRLRSCADHATRACELALALCEWKKAEKLYWDSMKEKICCGTCNSCPLQARTREAV